VLSHARSAKLSYPSGICGPEHAGRLSVSAIIAFASVERGVSFNNTVADNGVAGNGGIDGIGFRFDAELGFRSTPPATGLCLACCSHTLKGLDELIRDFRGRSVEVTSMGEEQHAQIGGFTQTQPGGVPATLPAAADLAAQALAR